MLRAVPQGRLALIPCALHFLQNCRTPTTGTTVAHRNHPQQWSGCLDIAPSRLAGLITSSPVDQLW